MELKPIAITEFKGLNEVSNFRDTDPGTLSAANNMLLTDASSLKSRSGYTKTAEGFSQTFFGSGGGAGYGVLNGALYRLGKDGSPKETLIEGIEGRVYWAEMGDAVVVSGAVYAVLRGSDVQRFAQEVPALSVSRIAGNLGPGTYKLAAIPEGSETPASPPLEMEVEGVSDSSGFRVANTSAVSMEVYITDADGAAYHRVGGVQPNGIIEIQEIIPRPSLIDLTSLEHPAFPECSHVTWFQGRVWRAQYVAATHTTFLLPSKAFSLGLCDYSDYAPIPGKVTMMAATESRMFIGTESRVYSFDGNSLNVEQNSGCPDHLCTAKSPAEELFFWTNRGLAKVEPFALVTENSVREVRAKTVAVQLLQDPAGDQIVVIFNK